MKALFTLKSAINQSSSIGIIALIAIAPLVLPQLALAAELQTLRAPALVFQIKNPELDNTQTQTNSVSYDEAMQKDPEYIALKNYLLNYNSPLTDYTGQLLQLDNWKELISISFVESNMCKRHLYYNCSGIGGQAYLRHYQDFGQWIDDMSMLLDTRYQGWSFKKMDGVYVQPYSYNWRSGAEKIYAELASLDVQAQADRQKIAEASALANNPNAVTTFPELALLTK